jgi:hypothetical protein
VRTGRGGDGITGVIYWPVEPKMRGMRYQIGTAPDSRSDQPIPTTDTRKPRTRRNLDLTPQTPQTPQTDPYDPCHEEPIRPRPSPRLGRRRRSWACLMDGVLRRVDGVRHGCQLLPRLGLTSAAVGFEPNSVGVELTHSHTESPWGATHSRGLSPLALAGAVRGLS